MNELYIGFSKPKKFKLFSWLIRIVENTNFSHVYIMFYSSKYERWLIYQASGSMVNFIEAKRFFNKNEIIKTFLVVCSEDSRTKAITKAIDYCSAPYGIKQIFGILCVKIARLFNKDIKNPFSDGEATWVCSEIVTSMLKELGMDVGIKLDNVTPKDVYKFLESIKQNG